MRPERQFRRRVARTDRTAAAQTLMSFGSSDTARHSCSTALAAVSFPGAATSRDGSPMAAMNWMSLVRTDFRERREGAPRNLS